MQARTTTTRCILPMSVNGLTQHFGTDSQARSSEALESSLSTPPPPHNPFYDFVLKQTKTPSENEGEREGEIAVWGNILIQALVRGKKADVGGRDYWGLTQK